VTLGVWLHTLLHTSGHVEQVQNNLPTIGGTLLVESPNPSSGTLLAASVPYDNAVYDSAYDPTSRAHHRGAPLKQLPYIGGERQGMDMATRSEDVTGVANFMSAVRSVLSGDGARGRTADDIAAALNLPADGAALQVHLETLVRRGVLVRRGISRGALYTLVTPIRAARALRVRARRMRARARTRAESRADTRSGRGTTPTLQGSMA